MFFVCCFVAGGQAEFVAGVNDFGAGDIPLGATDFETMTVTNGKTVLHIPFVIGAVSFFHSVPNMPNLKLSGCVLAGIYQGTITAWDDPAIKALNPGFNPPSGILSVYLCWYSAVGANVQAYPIPVYPVVCTHTQFVTTHAVM